MLPARLDAQAPTIDFGNFVSGELSAEEGPFDSCRNVTVCDRPSKSESCRNKQIQIGFRPERGPNRETS
jgi:hypothetical protein